MRGSETIGFANNFANFDKNLICNLYIFIYLFVYNHFYTYTKKCIFMNFYFIVWYIYSNPSALP